MTATDPTTTRPFGDPAEPVPSTTASTFTDDLIRLVERATAPEVDQLIFELRDLRSIIEPRAERATAILQELQRRNVSFRDELARHLPNADVSVADAMADFVDEVTGYSRLWDALGEVSRLLDPEELTGTFSR